MTNSSSSSAASQGAFPNFAAPPRVAVVLAGCGAKDGTEITEAVSLLVCLSQQGFQVDVFAPDRNTHHVVNHLTGSDVAEMRNMLTEAARIARGAIQPIGRLEVANYDALALAGGFGVAKNLCNFAFNGKDANLHDDTRRALIPFLRAHKPVAALCIAPVVLALGAREVGLKGVRLTLGDGSAKDAIDAVTAWGCAHVPTPVNGACVDSVHRFVSAPAYMYAQATPADIFASADALVRGLATLVQPTRPE